MTSRRQPVANHQEDAILKTNLLILGAIVGVSATIGCDDHDDGIVGFPPSNLLGTITAENLSELAQAVTDANIESNIRNDELTVFGPTNEAFSNLNTTFESKKLLANLLLYHVVADHELTLEKIQQGDGIITLTKWPLKYERNTLNGSELSGDKLNIEASNGLLNIIERVLIPPTIYEAAVATPTLSKLSELLNTENEAVITIRQMFDAKDADDGVLSTLGIGQELTVFAPENTAFTGDTPEGEDMVNLLRYHAVKEQLLSRNLMNMDGQILTTISPRKMKQFLRKYPPERCFRTFFFIT